MIRTLFIIFFTVIITGFFAVIAILTSFVSKGGEIPHKVARIWAKCILAASNITVSVKGLSNLDPNGSYIYMPNHMSNFDIPVLQAYLPVQFRWLAKAELFRIPVFGYAMQRAGYISINRFNRKSAIESLNKAAEIIKNGVTGFIVPHDNEKEFANKLFLLLNNKELREKMGKAAKERINEFHINKNIEKTQLIYSKIITSC